MNKLRRTCKIRIGNLLVIVLSFCISFIFSGQSGYAQSSNLKNYPFGMVLAMTGPGAWYGATMSRAAELAVEEINASGGVAGYKLVPVIEDHRSGDTSAGQAGVRKLIDIDKVAFIAGSYGSVCTSIQPICAENHILLINGGGTAPSLLNKPYLYNTRALGDACALGALKYLWEKRGSRRLATIYWNQESGVTINQAAVKAWKSWGGTVVKETLVASGQTSFTGEISQIKAAKPDCIGIWSYQRDVGYTLKDIKRMGLAVPVCGVEFIPDIVAIAGKAFEGFFLGVDYFDPNLKNPMTENFAKHFYAKYGADAKLDYYTANYYDITYLLKELISRVAAKGGNPFDGAHLLAALQQNPHFDTVYGGKMDLNENGSVNKRISIFEVRNGEQVKISQ
jgi:branched-chain amino acid transport system substrate-binding protein